MNLTRMEIIVRKEGSTENELCYLIETNQPENIPMNLEPIIESVLSGFVFQSWKKENELHLKWKRVT